MFMQSFGGKETKEVQRGKITGKKTKSYSALCQASVLSMLSKTQTQFCLGDIRTNFLADEMK